ncbi:MAG: CRTAC1 family protein [Planctomycetota bacterium]
MNRHTHVASASPACGLLAALLSALSNAPGAEALRIPRFRDVAKEAGIDFTHVRGSLEKDYLVETKGGGCAVFDYDGDGREDIYFVNGSTFEDLERGTGPGNLLYRNEGSWRFREVGEAAGVADRGWGIACAVADYDDDGRLDLYVTNWGPNRLFRNRGDGTFEDVTEKARVGCPGFSAGAVFADLDRDGWLDLYVANYVVFEKEKTPRRGESPTCQLGGIPILVGPVGLPRAADVYYHNERDGTFSDGTARAGFAAVEPGYGLGAIAGDVNQDGWPDIYVANDSSPNFLFLNRGDGTVEEIGFESGVAFNAHGVAQAGMGTEMGDFSGSGREDIFVCNFENDTNAYYRNEGDLFFVEESSLRGLAAPSYRYVSWSVLAFDANLDGALDLFVGNGHVVPQADRTPVSVGYRQPNQLFLNRGGGRFDDVSAEAGPGLAVRGATRGSAMGDLDGDGDTDLVFNNLDGTPTVLECEGPPLGPWIGVRLASPERNRFAIGAWVGLVEERGRELRYVRAQRSWGSSSETTLRFGLASARAEPRVFVLWPSGREEAFSPGAPGRVATLVEGTGLEAAWPFFEIPKERRLPRAAGGAGGKK